MLRPSEWMMSTYRASLGSRWTTSAVSSKYGSAGSRPETDSRHYHSNIAGWSYRQHSHWHLPYQRSRTRLLAHLQTTVELSVQVTYL